MEQRGGTQSCVASAGCTSRSASGATPAGAPATRLTYASTHHTTRMAAAAHQVRKLATHQRLALSGDGEAAVTVSTGAPALREVGRWVGEGGVDLLCGTGSGSADRGRPAAAQHAQHAALVGTAAPCLGPPTAGGHNADFMESCLLSTPSARYAAHPSLAPASPGARSSCCTWRRQP